MNTLQRNWEKLFFVLSLVLVGVAGYRIYLDVEEASNDQRITETVKRVQQQLNRSPELTVSDPGFAGRLSERWSPIGRTPTSKDFVLQMPVLVRPVLDRSPEQRCVIPGIAQFQVEGQIGTISLQWSFADIPEEQGVVPVEPGVVDLQRRQVGDDSWSTVFSFEGKEETSFSDSDVDARTQYEYRVRVGKGNQTCEPDDAEFIKKRKYSNVVTAEAKRSIELVLKSTSQDSVLIQVRKLASDGSIDAEEGDWVEEGDRIGEDDFSTPYTLSEIQPDASYTYFTLVEDSDWEDDTEKRVGVVRREQVKRSRVTYKDQSGNTYQLWSGDQQGFSNQIQGQTPPWQRNDLNFDTFRIYADEVFGTPVPEPYRVDAEEGQSANGSSSEDSQGDDSADDGTSEDTSVENSNQ